MRLSINYTFFFFSLFIVDFLYGQSKPIDNLFKNYCTVCHHKGVLNTFSLETFDDYMLRKEMIKKVIAERIMPPMNVDTQYRTFYNHLMLDSTDIKRIIEWLDKPLPFKKIELSNGSKPVKSRYRINLLPDTIVLKGNKDIYIYRILNINLINDIFVTNYWFDIKNSQLHHAELLSVLPNTRRIQKTFYVSEYELKRDDLLIDEYLLGWFPGSSAGIFPKNSGILLRKDREYMLILHYTPSDRNSPDHSVLNLNISKGNQKLDTIYEFAIHGTYQYINLHRQKPFLKANELKRFVFKDTVKTDLLAFAVYFHAHHLAQNVTAYAVSPNGDTINLLKIIRWNFNWQHTYRFNSYILIPKGTIIYCDATYNNTIQNPDQQSIPPVDVMPSFYSRDEMFELFILSIKNSTKNNYTGNIDWN